MIVHDLEGGGQGAAHPDTVYDIHYATVDEYNGRLSPLDSGTVIPDEGRSRCRGGGQVFAGAIVHVGPGLGARETLR
jgi:replication factor A1